MFLLEKILFFLLLLFLPTQLGKHFWPSFSLVLGQRIDYLSPTLYVTDILIGLLFLIQIIRFFRFVISSEERIEKSHVTFLQKLLSVSQFRNLRGVRSLDFARDNQKWLFSLVFILVFLSINISFSLSPLESLYGLLKLFEIAFLVYYTSNILRTNLKILLFPLTFGIISESVLAMVQFFTQGSVGGFLYFFGERTFTSVTPGIANTSINGQLVLRPYGTFSHPNVLAGYLVIAMTMLIANFKLRITNYSKFLVYSSLIIGTVGLLFTLSRVAILVWFFVCSFLFITYFRKRLVSRKILFILYSLLGFFVIALFVITPLLPRFSSLTLQDESVVLREQLTQDAFRMMFAHPVFGVGLHTFLIALPHYDVSRGSVFSIQPVHNIFLLIGAETGFIGLWISVAFIIWVYLRLFRSYRCCVETFPCNVSTWNIMFSIILLSEVIVLGSFDHYFLTLQQGQLLLSLVLGYCSTIL